MSKGLYEKMYFRQDKTEGVKLPIKWMAIESVDDGIFSEKSDVVSWILITGKLLINQFKEFHSKLNYNIIILYT